MNKINKKALLFSLILTVISGFFLFSYIRSNQTPVEQKPKTSIFVAAREILPGEIIQPTDIQSIEVTSDSVPEGILSDRTKIENMLALERIVSGEPFRESRLQVREKMDLAWNVPAGKRAITIFVNETAVLANMLRVGDRIDLIATFEATEETDAAWLRSTGFLVQDVEVAALGSDRHGELARKEAAGEKTEIPTTLTLFVDPEQAEKIVFAGTYGSYTVVLRGRGDAEPVNLPGIITEDVMPAAARTEPGMSGGASDSQGASLAP